MSNRDAKNTRVFNAVDESVRETSEGKVTRTMENVCPRSWHVNHKRFRTQNFSFELRSRLRAAFEIPRVCVGRF